MATLTITIRPTQPTADEKYPIFIRVAAKSEKAFIKTEYKIDDIAEWYKGKVVARPDAAMMNKRLLYELKKYKDRMEFIENNDCYTALQLKSILVQQEKIAPSVVTFNDFMRQRIEELKEEGREGYAKMNGDTLKVFEAAEGDVPMIIMNHITIEHFDKWLKKSSRSEGGRQIRLCHIKARVNEAIRNGLLRCSPHPFAYTKLPSPNIREIDLSINYMRRIIAYDASVSKRYSIAKDLFLLSFYMGGMNFADIVQANFSGKTVSYERKKSKEHKTKNRVTRISITPEVQTIIDKYLGKDGFLNFGYNYSQKNLQCYINTCLKLLAKELNLDNSITFYSARKTFAQFAAEIGIPYPIIEYCLGHSIKTGVTINSYVRVKPEQADIAIQRVIEYTKNPEAFKDFINFRAQVQMMIM